MTCWASLRFRFVKTPAATLRHKRVFLRVVELLRAKEEFFSGCGLRAIEGWLWTTSLLFYGRRSGRRAARAGPRIGLISNVATREPIAPYGFSVADGWATPCAAPVSGCPKTVRSPRYTSTSSSSYSLSPTLSSVGVNETTAAPVPYSAS